MAFSVSGLPVLPASVQIIRAGERTVEHPGPGLGRDEEQPGPDGGVAEVVRVAGVAPEPGVQHGAATGRVGLEPRELPVARPSRRTKPEQPAAATPGDGQPADRLPVLNMPTWTVSETKNITTPWGR